MPSLRAERLTFACSFVNVRVEHAASRFTGACAPGDVLRPAPAAERGACELAQGVRGRGYSTPMRYG